MNRPDPFPANMLVGLSGPVGSGKDTCAGVLAEYGFTPLAFADALRDEIVAAFGIDRRLLTERTGKEAPTPALAIARCTEPPTWPGFRACMANLGHNLAEPRSPRWILQRWGTEYRRGQNIDYWTLKMARRIGELRGSARSIRRASRDAFTPSGARICVTDVRFGNELAYLRSIGGNVVYVHRPDKEHRLASDDTAAHSSEPETLARDLPVVHNDGDLEHLHAELLRVLAPAPGAST